MTFFILFGLCMVLNTLAQLPQSFITRNPISILENATGVLVNLAPPSTPAYESYILVPYSVSAYPQLSLDYSSGDLSLLPQYALDASRVSVIELDMRVLDTSRINVVLRQEHIVLNIQAVTYGPITLEKYWNDLPKRIKTVLYANDTTPPYSFVYRMLASQENNPNLFTYGFVPGREEDAKGKFQVNSQTGVLMTVGSTFSKNTRYNISLRVVQGDKFNSSRAYKDISVYVYSNYQPVQFPQYVNVIPFDEESDSSISIGTVSAKVINYLPDPMVFNFSGANDKFFRVITNNGSLYANQNFDYDSRIDRAWDMLALVSENSTGLWTGSAIMRFQLQDINDNPPYFPAAMINVTVPPTSGSVTYSTPIANISVLDNDTLPENRFNTYTLNGTGASYFTVSRDPISGNALLWISQNVSFYNLPLSNPYYEATLMADDGFDTGSTIIRVYGGNSNRNAPQFIDNSFNVTITRNMVNNVIYQIVAIDIDGSEIEYYFYDPLQTSSEGRVSTVSPFAIDKSTGVVSIISSVTSVNGYNLSVIAVDNGLCLGCSIVSNPVRLVSQTRPFIVTIFEANYFLPSFTNCPATLSITEENKNGTFVGTITATDKDLMSSLSYRFIPNVAIQNPTSYLWVGETNGSIYANMEFKREELESDLKLDILYFTLRVTDSGSPTFSSLCTFQLIVNDINNNNPVFYPRENITVLKTGSSPVIFDRVFAYDRDDRSTNNGIVKYKLDSTSPSSSLTLFSVNSDSGELSFSGAAPTVDTTFNLTITAFNPTTPPRSASILYRIYFASSLNSWPPVLNTTYFNYPNFLENTMGVLDGLVLSFDLLPGTKSSDPYVKLLEVTAPVTKPPSTNYFQLNTMPPPPSSLPITGRLQLVKSVKYYAVNRFYLCYVAYNGYDPVINQIFSTGFIEIPVIDVNNESPVFINIDTRIPMPENYANNSAIFQNFAYDRDVTPAAYKTVTFSLQPGPLDSQTKFRIENGLIYTNSTTFDYENAINTFTLYILAQDGAFSSITPNKNNAATIAVTVALTDVNDEPPKFNSSIFNITNYPENAAILSTVTVITAQDPDSPVFYSLQDMNTTNAISRDFVIHQLNGTVFVARRLDSLAKRTYFLSVIANDGFRNTSTMLIINLLTVNIRPPYFNTNSLQLSVPENRPPGVVGQVQAIDPEGNKNLRYHLLPFNYQPFTIDEVSGVINVTTTLDCDPPNGTAKWNLTIYAEDNPSGSVNLRGFATVIISVTDVNDNAPIWLVESLYQTVNEGETNVGTLSALDVDLDPANRVITYTLIKGPSTLTVAPNGGVQLSTPLSYDANNPPILTYTVIAANPGTTLSSTATITVFVQDVSNNAPYFPTKSYSIVMSEDLPVGAQFFSVRALDEDVIDDGLLTYQLVATSDLFNVVNLPDVNSGIIQLKSVVDYEKLTSKQYLLNIVVKDSGGRTDTCSVTVSIAPVSKYTPQVTLTPLSKTVQENDLTKSTISIISVKSQSTADNDFTISIDSLSNVNNVFALKNVQPTQADLFINGSLTREMFTTDPNVEQISWYLLILVSNKREPRRTGTATLTISITDINNNAPQLNESNSYVTVSENVPAGTTADPSRLYAYDIDYNVKNGPPFTYSFDSKTGNWSGNFKLLTGDASTFSNNYFSIQTLQNFSYDSLQEPYQYYLPLVIADRGGKSATSTVTVSILRNRLTDTFKTADVYVSQNWPWFYGNYSATLNVDYVDAIQVRDARAQNNYVFVNPSESYYTFVMNSSGYVQVLGNCSTGTFYINATVTRGNVKVLAIFQLNVYFTSREAIQNAILVGVSGINREQFFQRRSILSASNTMITSYDYLRLAFSSLLSTKSTNVDIVSVEYLSKGNYLSVLVAAHGSPYYYSTRLNYLISKGLAALNQNMSSSGTQISMLPVDLCQDENALQCSDGCRTSIQENDDVGVPSTGRNYAHLGLNVTAVTSCGCQTQDVTFITQCDSNSCLNGGTCTVSNGTQTPYCTCPQGFNGPRCQALQVGFTSPGYALLESMDACSSLQISFYFLTAILNTRMLLFYAGPIELSAPTGNVGKDYLAIELTDSGKLQIFTELGSGSVTQILNQSTSLNDNLWHRVDVILKNGLVTMYVDECLALVSSGNGQPLGAQSAKCYLQYQSLGSAQQLNVASYPLQIGGRVEQQSTSINYYPQVLTKNGFIGVIRNLRVNGALYDLNVLTQGFGLNAAAVPTPITASCQKSGGSPRCGDHGECWGYWNGIVDSGYCDCAPGWHIDSEGRCTLQDNAKEFKTQSFIRLQRKNSVNPMDIRWSQIDVMFRTRQMYGTILEIKGVWPQMYRSDRIELRLEDSMLLVVVDFSGFSSSTLKLANANVSDGYMHSVRVRRSLSAVEILLNGGDGYTYRYQPVDIATSFNYLNLGTDINVGALVSQSDWQSDYVITRSESDLIDTCVMDVRVSNGWYALDVTDPYYSLSNGTLLQSVNVSPKCSNLTNCIVSSPTPTPCVASTNQMCVPAWKPGNKSVCGCGYNSVLFAQQCYQLNPCLPNPCQNNASCVVNGIYPRCLCKSGCSGNLCENCPDVANAGLGAGFIVLIVLVLLLLIILLVLFIYWIWCAPPAEPLLAPEEYQREKLAHYVDGSGEMDTMDFDLSKLAFPAFSFPPIQYLPSSLPQELPRELPPLLEDCMRVAEDNLIGPPQDYTLDYGYEGVDSDEENDLSSLYSDAGDEKESFDYLQDWGPSFSPLANLYAAEPVESSKQ